MTMRTHPHITQGWLGAIAVGLILWEIIIIAALKLIRLF